jgi:hypothetical protein
MDTLLIYLYIIVKVTIANYEIADYETAPCGGCHSQYEIDHWYPNEQEPDSVWLARHPQGWDEKR